MPEDMMSSPAAPEKASNPPELAEDKLCNDTGPVPAPNATKPEPEPEPEPEPALPPLTPQEFRIYNRLAEKMEYFHDHFRQMYTTLHTACTNNRRPAGMSLKQFIEEGLSLTRYLEMHHSIEETHLYPLLGRKMAEFRATAPPPGLKRGSGGKKRREECELLRQHKVIHDGMDEMADYLRRCKSGECAFEMGVLKEKLDACGDMLLRHLDEEVRDLGAEKMRKYWTVAEMRAFPI